MVAMPAVRWLFGAVLCACLALAQAESLPLDLPGGIVVSAERVAWLPATLRTIDVRPLHDFLAGRIPGSLHVAYKEGSAKQAEFNPAQDSVPAFLKRLHKLVPVSDTPLLFYCNGLSCWKSYKAAKVAMADGYTQVYWLRGGLPEWEAAGLAVERE